VAGLVWPATLAGGMVGYVPLPRTQRVKQTMARYVSDGERYRMQHDRATRMGERQISAKYRATKGTPTNRKERTRENGSATGPDARPTALTGLRRFSACSYCAFSPLLPVGWAVSERPYTLRDATLGGASARSPVVLLVSSPKML